MRILAVTSRFLSQFLAGIKAVRSRCNVLSKEEDEAFGRKGHFDGRMMLFLSFPRIAVGLSHTTTAALYQLLINSDHLPQKPLASKWSSNQHPIENAFVNKPMLSLSFSFQNCDCS